MTFINKQNIPQEQNLKQSENYIYNSSTRSIIIEDVDFKKVVSIYNETINKTLYILGSEDYSGTLINNEVKYTNVVSGVGDSDELYILYKPKQEKDILEPLEIIKEELKQLNKSINKIRE